MLPIFPLSFLLPWALLFQCWVAKYRKQKCTFFAVNELSTTAKMTLKQLYININTSISRFKSNRKTQTFFIIFFIFFILWSALGYNETEASAFNPSPTSNICYVCEFWLRSQRWSYLHSDLDVKCFRLVLTFKTKHNDFHEMRNFNRQLCLLYVKCIAAHIMRGCVVVRTATCFFFFFPFSFVPV